MKLDDAVEEGTQLVARLKGRDAIVVYSLVELGRAVLKSRRPIRALADILAPEAHLNQEPLFAETEEKDGV